LSAASISLNRASRSASSAAEGIIRRVMMSPLRFAAMVSPSAIANARGKRTATLLPDLKVLVWTGLFMELYIRDIRRGDKLVLNSSDLERQIRPHR
jgi:L-arabinose isomerase